MIGILYESNEWSDHKLAAEIENCGQEVTLLDMEDPSNNDLVFSCDLLVSRVFASAMFRGHSYSLERMPRIFEVATQMGIPVINPAQAHFFEVDKAAATKMLGCAGLSVPKLYACHTPTSLMQKSFDYPCIIKPNCGGRTTYTTIAHNAEEATEFLKEMPDVPFLAEEYLMPERRYITRVEIVGGNCAHIAKRSVAENGLSAYRFGSTYEPYPFPGEALIADCIKAARKLSIELGSFDIIENDVGRFFIDANAVSNVAEDGLGLLGIDLMKAHADYIVEKYRALNATAPTLPLFEEAG